MGSISSASAAAATALPWSNRAPPPVRPLAERALDTAIFTGGIGGFAGACVSTYCFGSVAYGVIALGGFAAVTSATFIGLRHAITQGDFRQDSEVVSGMAAGTIASVQTALSTGLPRAGAFAGGVGFVGGCALHHAHRHWLLYRLKRNW